MKNPQHLVPAAAVLALTAGLSGCGESRPVAAPAGPSPVLQSPVRQPAYTLAGLVFVATPSGRVPLVGARVEEVTGHSGTVTGSDGTYILPGLNGSASVSASRWDVVTYTNTLTISGDTSLDIELPTYTLSGVVFERTPTGTAPLEGVDVYCDGCGSPYGHTFSRTGADGVYSFSYTYSGTNPLLIFKAGYGPAQGSTRPMVNGDTRFDIELVRR